MSRGKLRWGDTLDDDENVLPPSSVRGPDEHGVKTVIDYYRNDKGDAFKKTTKLKIVTVDKKVYKISEQRKNWPKFGAALKETPQDSVTVQAVEDIPFERVRQAKQTSQEKKATDVQQMLATADKQAISGSIKDILYRKRMERELMRAKGLLKEAEKPPEEGDGPSKPTSLGAPKAGSYVPPSLRGGGRSGPGAGGDGETMQRRREENSVRVTNLSEDVTEADLSELFRPFGPISRIFLAVDRTTGESRGFAFVNYVHREDAERAIRALNGFGYDNLILKVEYAAPREARG
mmetsp:Transcript_26050/g.56868  ORF Transcript_26050/g.56868 Transcript_26050/m.56868 type:complete len:291 (+) Transcript_26050:70-942(+)|eukprot:CAMPEP_0202901118 /NCGR_PEP_ID=MMETSP1392-20130828/13381_1 /ASSEMBLY_ACC=CAM_ASM_000868 /TAXON_ID=225041 /ORGANISM="Chlamydomonas chlamydogama, Strain SAG 11-48b" /LENGTH=290 /DNA_ID=CAMNT_0049587623 /DNA_START=67 /DNA_END=939 /DNA_ORIENTATION=+